MAEDGTVWIGYCCHIRWSLLRISLASSLLPPIATTARQRGSNPHLHEGRLTWSEPSLGVDATIDASVPGAETSLSPDIDWRCLIPAGAASIRVGDRTILGRGYAELLEMRIPPWRVPIDELRWGRAIGDQTSLVWIEWRGPAPLRVGLRNGVLAPVITIGDDEVTFADGTRIVMSDRSVIRSEPIAVALRPLPLHWLLPRSFTAAVEQKWRSRGTIFTADRSIDTGFVVHERVTFTGV